MPNVINADGLEVKTREELISEFTTAMEAIYGSDIDLSSNAPDGQMMNIYLQAVLDLEDLLVEIYNMFDPDNAIGVILDQRVAINGIQRQGGTFTVTNVTVVTSQSLNLFGLDQSVEPVFTVADNAGNEFQLQTTQNTGGPGSFVYAFQAAVPGEVLTIPNTIQVPVSIILGVTSVNNPTAATTTGTNEESDAVLKVRRQRSVALASQGYYASLYAALSNLDGVTSVAIYENVTGATDGDGIPGHSIWVIVSGTATDADIADVIYKKRNAGCGMKGDTTYTITRVDGSPFLIRWDEVTPENLFIAFTATSIDGDNLPDLAAIRSELPTLFIPGVNEEVNITNLGAVIQQIDSNTLVTGAGFSSGFSQVATLSGIAASGTFKVSYNGNASAAINWNDAIGVIQTKVQAVTGLSGALVTGSIASQSLTFNLAALESAAALIVVIDNTLQTSAPAAITFSFNEGYTNTLAPITKDKQFAVSSANIIILPMILSPTTSSVAPTEEVQFTGLGGYGDPVYSFQTNNSGGTINAGTGLYAAGVTPSVTDTLKVTDAFGNTATATVSVTA